MDLVIGARALAGCALAVSLLAGPADAEYPRTKFQGIGFQAGMVNGSATDAGTKLAFDVDLGTVWRPWLGVTAGVGVASADLVDLGLDRSGDMRDVFVRGLARAELKREGTWRPHLTGGIGLHTLRIRIPSDDALENALDGTKFGAEFGAGTSYAWTDNLLGHAEVTRVFVPDLSRWSFNLGVMWRFGGAHRYESGTRSFSEFGVAHAPSRSSGSSRSSVAVAPASASSGAAARSAAIADVRKALRKISERTLESDRAMTTGVTETAPDRTRVIETQAALVALASDLGAAAEVEPGRREIRIRPDSFRFSSAKTSLSVEGEELVARAARVLIRFPNVHLFIEGHTDATGSVARNLKISRQRAATVRDAFTRQGVPSDQMTLVPLASGAPLVAERTTADRARNRRAELRLVITN